MTHEKAVKVLSEESCYECAYGTESAALCESDCNLKEATKLAIKALEKQIPKKPFYEGDGYDPDGNLVYDTWRCPCCDKDYEIDYEEHEHCPKCGQAIDWSE